MDGLLNDESFGVPMERILAALAIGTSTTPSVLMEPGSITSGLVPEASLCSRSVAAVLGLPWLSSTSTTTLCPKMPPWVLFSTLAAALVPSTAAVPLAP